MQIPVEQDRRDEYLTAAAQQLKTSLGSIELVKVLNKALDATNAEQFYYDLTLVVRTPDTFDNRDKLPHYTEKPTPAIKPRISRQRPIIIGFGPAGMFAALELLEYGLKPVIFERGKKIEERSIDVQRFIKERVIDPESNIQFGEG